MWALIDNYDSFTYMLHDYLLQAGVNDCVVFRNDSITLEHFAALKPARIIISPGPETPLQAGITMDVIKQFHQQIPILGVCLGHQALGMFFGDKLTYLPYPMHGKTSTVTHNNHVLFQNIPSPFTVMRYHSLQLEGLTGSRLQSIAVSEDDNCCMAIAHEQYPCIGVQFHPESISTEYGLQLIKNWVEMKF